MQDKKKRFLVPALFPPILCLILAIVAYFASIPISYFFSPLNRIDSLFDLAVSPEIFSLCRAILYLVTFGLWYSHILFPGWTKTFGAPIDVESRTHLLDKKYMHPLPWIFLIPLGFSLQFTVNAFFSFLQHTFPAAMAKYSNVIKEMTVGDRNGLSILSVIFLMPLAEEIIFRGITLHYAGKAMKPLYAAVFSSVCFAVYQFSLFPAVFALFFGFLLALLKQKSGGLLPPLLLHISLNISLYVLPKNILASGMISLLFMLSALLLSLFLAVPAIRFYDGKKPFRSAHPDTSSSDDRPQP